MVAFVATLESVAVLLGLGALGFWVIARRVIPATTFATLSPLALDLGLPALVFVEILARLGATGDWRLLALPLWMVGFFLVATAFAFLGSLWVAPSFRPELRAGLMYQNSIFFPLAIITGTFGPDSPLLAMLFLLTLAHPPLTFGTYAFLWRRPDQPLPWRRIANPVVFGATLAVGLALFGVAELVPDPLVRLLRLLGGVALPVIMLIIGGSIYTDLKGNGPLHRVEVAKFLLLKLVLFPLVVLGLLLVIRPEVELAYLLLLQSAVPSISGVPVFADRMGGNRAFANQLIAAGFVCSVVTIPLAVLLFDRLFAPPW